MNRRIGLALAFLAMLSPIEAFGGGSAKVGTKESPITVRVGTQPYYDYQFFKVARALGVDREFGLDLIDVPQPGQTAYAQLARGDIDIAASCQSCLLPAIENYPKLRHFLITERFEGFVLIGRLVDGVSAYKTYDDLLQGNGGDEERARRDFVATLKGRSFAINPAADGALLGALLDHADLTADDVEIVSFPDEAKAALAFIAGSGDYYFGSLPQELRMLTSPDLQSRFVQAGPASLFPLNYANFAATAEWLEENEETAVRLVAVWLRVTRYLYEQPVRMLGLIASELRSQTGGLLSEEQTLTALTEFMYFAPFEKVRESYFNPDSPTWEGKALKELYRQAVLVGQISEGTDFRDFETSQKYFDLLTERPDLIAIIQAPLT